MKRTFAIGIVLLFATAAFAKHPKIAPELDGVDVNKKISVIVRYKNSPTDSQLKIAKKYGQLKFKHGRVHAASFKMKRSQLEKLLAEDPNIAMISPDRPVKAMNDYTAASVGATIAQSLGFDGQGVGVAVIDSGVMDHPDLHNYKKDQKNDGDVSRIVYSESFVDGDPNGTDKDGHGTHVAGIVAGNGNSSTCNTCTNAIVGIAPGVNLINLRALDASGNGSDSQTIAAIDRAIELKDKYNIRVINLSMGRPVYESYKTDPLCQAVESAWNAGIVVVVSAGNLGRSNGDGNNGYGTITAPGNDPYVITVGAMKAGDDDDRSDDTIASYSSKGPSILDHIVKPDLVAPGNKVESLYVPDSTLATAMPDAVVPVAEYNTTGVGQPAYFRMSGTSMAAPVVSGAAALLIEKNPSLTPDQVKAILMETATRNFPASSSVTDPTTGITYTSNYDPFTVGAGYLDIQDALDATATPVALGAAQSPTAQHNATTGTMTMAGVPGTIWDATTTSTVWGSQGVSAEGIIWGSLNVSGDASDAIWSEGIIWGSSGLDGEGIIWGSLQSEGIIWGSLASEGIIWGSLDGGGE
jgi:serine protease AprX